MLDSVRIAFAFLASLGLSLAADTNPFAGDSVAAGVGRGNFRLYCSACHGMRAQGGRGGPDLTRGSWHAGDTDGDLFRTIANGVPGTEMQAYSSNLTADTIWRIVTFIRSTVQPDQPPPPGDRAKGETLFWGKAGCGACHAVGARGGRLGPELTRVGRRQSAAKLRQSMISPDADPTPGYDTVTVVKKDGTRISGIEKGFDNFTVQLMDPAQHYYSFDRSEIASAKRVTSSLMPGNYEARLTPSELDDVIAYLSSLQGGGSTK